ncbi:MAG: hypothetical protein AAFV53_33295 [Myxococcota bacterium]
MRRVVGGFALVMSGCGVDYDIARGDYNVGGDEEVVEPESSEPVGALEAVCSVSPNPVEPPFEAATWDGSASVDTPQRSIVSYSWELIEKPAGSAVDLPYTDEAVISGFTPDVAGDYVAELTVTNDIGDVATCQATLASVPAQNLWIELNWTVAPDDMDLHLLRPGGVYGTSGDCHWTNCDTSDPSIPLLQWGSGGVDDDPRLDLDDIEAAGPENINITEPYAGIYTIAVHDYFHRGLQADHWGANEVTVNVYIDGALEWSGTRTISGEDEVVYFAEIDWNTGTVYGL